jgi:hypothetical protein
MRTIYTILITAVLAFLLGLAVFWGFSNSGEQTTHEEATVLLEQIRKVTKLVTVEGDVSELYNSTKTKEVTLYIPLPARLSFEKSATVQVEGTVLVGYDLEQLSIDVDEVNRIVTLGNLPEPEILAIDHELIYRNLEESWFNSFTAEDYSMLNKEAKTRLRDEALKSKLMEEARLEGNTLIDAIRFLAKGADFEVLIEGERPAAPQG